MANETPKKRATKPEKNKKKKTISAELRKQVLDNQQDVTKHLPDQSSLDRSDEQHRLALKKKVRYAYDLQRIRLQMGGRNLERGTKPGETDEKVSIDLHPVDQEILDIRANEMERAEDLAFKDVERHLETMAVYQVFKARKAAGEFKGIGVKMIAVIFSENDVRRQDTPSKMWAFAGLAPVEARRCTQCNQVVEKAKGGKVYRHAKGALKSIQCVDVMPIQQTYPSGMAMKPRKGEKLRYNSFLKTKMVGVMADCLIKANGEWKKVYDDYKHRLQSSGRGVNDANRHNSAKRYMVKMALIPIWRMMREAEGLPVRPSYHEEKLGHVHSG